MRFEFGVSGLEYGPYQGGNATLKDGQEVTVPASSGTSLYYIQGSENYNKANPGQPVYLCASHLGGLNVTGLDPALQSDGTYRMRGSCMGCGSNGLKNNPHNSTKAPCVIVVDVNGDRKPNPVNKNCKPSIAKTCANTDRYKWPKDDKKFAVLFHVMITDREAIPYGAAAQKAVYKR